jgi:hypothetical protein
MKRYKATFKTRFSFGFDALNRQGAQLQVDTIKKTMLDSFKKEYGDNVAITAKLEEMPF